MQCDAFYTVVPGPFWRTEGEKKLVTLVVSIWKDIIDNLVVKKTIKGKKDFTC